ncbi:MAG: energy-coupled thiamine transporter ThiT [Oscillospiraceae bacterium]|nr:energy-coupled thiamine transporter ThiT [Oscillospiraceae bacterium]
MKNMKVRALCEGAIMVALAQILEYIKLYQLPYGGSVTFAMIPLVLFAVRWGLSRGLIAGVALGLLQLALDGAYAYTWQSMILDYLLAYAALGFAGLFKGRKSGVFCGAFVGALARYAVHVLSGVYVWAAYMPEVFLGLPMGSAWIYSPLYNAVYMGPNLAVCLVVFGILYKPLYKYITAKDI